MNLSDEEARDFAQYLGLPSEGLGAVALRRLIATTVKEGKGKRGPSILDPAALLDRFERQSLTDCEIRVTLREGGGSSGDRLAKRAKTRASGAAAGVQQEDVRVVKGTFGGAGGEVGVLQAGDGGEWKEGQQRIIHLKLGDDEEFETFRLLIKLSYGSTFTKDGERQLEPEELMRLISVANAFECMDAIKECAVALQSCMNWERAVQCIELARLLDGVPAMEGLSKRAGDVLAKEVGQVHELWTPSRDKDKEEEDDDEDDDDDDDDADDEDDLSVRHGLSLADKITDLSADVFEALLSSMRLQLTQLKSENEAFWLLKSWLHAQVDMEEATKQQLFVRMAKHLRFQAMDPTYILLIVVKDPHIIKAGMGFDILAATLRRDHLGRCSREDLGICEDRAGEEAWGGCGQAGVEGSGGGSSGDCLAKRAKTDASGAAASGAAATESSGHQQKEDVRVIKAHSVVLAARSAYFKRAMEGEWKEGQQRIIQLKLGDDEEFETFRLLVKLSYGTTFTKDGERQLEPEELMRLIQVANAFECMDAIKECVVALQGCLTWERAVHAVS